MNYFREVKELAGLAVSDELLIDLVLEMGRFFDKEFTQEIQKIQKENDTVISSPLRKVFRKKYYYGKFCLQETPYSISCCKYTQDDVEKAFSDCYSRIKKYDSKKIIQSMKKRLDDLKNNTASDSNMEVWLKQYDKRRAKKKYSLVTFLLDQNTFEKSGYDEKIITDFIAKTYDGLENYRHLAIIVRGEIFNKKKECITWNLLYKAGVYAENFIQFKEKFFPFHKEKQIRDLSAFLNERKVRRAKELASEFYENISTGYKFEDCYVSDNQDQKVLIYKKIELDGSHVPCPSCNTIIQSGNSYPEMFLRSWECKNPACPDRSKSGRGKRFDEYGTYRYFKLVENDPKNSIDEKLYQLFHRDIFDHTSDLQEFLIKEYTFAKEKIMMWGCDVKKLYGRALVKLDVTKLLPPKNAVLNYDDLPIVKFYKNVIDNLDFKIGEKKLQKNLEVVNDDSSEFLQKIEPGQIGTAITSPPYYNAREYSQWNTMLMYFVDMMINCRAVYNALADGSYYLYNIGDIVSEDNIYVVSNMSKHRVQLGFWSSMIFELAGYTLTGNILWDKGEVQSKRNSTINLVSGYVKCINCYEHILVFRKGKFERLSNTVEAFVPVIKINSKGENTYKHTAPYPIDLVELARPYVNSELYMLDPFLGSGTTLKWCKENQVKGVGVELNKEYFELCLKNLRDEED